jgi:hypothetical protein
VKPVITAAVKTRIAPNAPKYIFDLPITMLPPSSGRPPFVPPKAESPLGRVLFFLSQDIRKNAAK